VVVVELESVSRSKLFRYYCVLAVGVLNPGGSGVMARKVQTQQQQVENQSPGPGGFSGGGRVVVSGDGWRVVERQVGGRVFYDLRLYATYDRSLGEILKEALPRVQEFAQEKGVLVSHTVFVGMGKRVTILIGAGGVSLKIPKPVSVAKLSGILKMLEVLNSG